MHDYNIRNCQKHSLWSHLDKLDITNNVNTTSNVPCTKNGSSVSLNIVIWNRHNTVASFSYKELISSGSYTLTIHMLDASIPKVLFHCVNHSEFLVMNHNIPRRTLTKKVKVMWFFFCGGGCTLTVPYPKGVLLWPHLDQVRNEGGAGGVRGNLRCKVANLKKCNLWLLRVLSCIILFALLWPVPHLTVTWFSVINPVTICCYSCFHIIIISCT